MKTLVYTMLHHKHKLNHESVFCKKINSSVALSIIIICNINSGKITSFSYSTHFMYRLETKAKGSTRYRNPRGSHIEHERVARGFYGDARVSIPRRSCWPRSLTGLEYSNRCYPTKGFRLHAFFCAAGGHYLCIGKHGDFSSPNGLPRPTTPC